MTHPLRKLARRGRRALLEAVMRTARPARRKEWNLRLNQRELWHGLSRLRSFPVFIQLGTNWSCNLRCWFCRREAEPYKSLYDGLPRERREISDVVLRKSLALMPYATAFGLAPLGEPLLYSRIDEILKTHRDYGCENLTITTNGIPLNEKIAEAVVRSRVRRLYVSMESHDPERYRALRVGGTLEKVAGGIGRVNDWKKKLASPLPELVMAATFMRENIEDLPGLIRFASERGFKEIRLQIMEPEDERYEDRMLRGSRELAARMISRGRRLAGELGLGLELEPGMRNFLEPPESKEDVATAPKMSLIQQCAAPWNSLMIDTDGQARPCCWAGCDYGNLNETSFAEIWNSRRARGLRECFLKERLPAACRDKHCGVRV